MMIEYLKKVCEIEKDKFLLQQMLQNEQDKIYGIDAELKSLRMKKRENVILEPMPKLVEPPKYVSEFLGYTLIGAVICVIIWFAIVFVAVMPTAMLGKSSVSDATESFLNLLMFILGGLDIIFAIMLVRTSASAYAKYEQEAKQVSIRNDNIERQHVALCKELDDKIYALNRIIVQCKDNINMLTKKHMEVEETLKKYYGLDIIYVKYQYMEAVYKLLEYMQSGRCNTLHGPSGAYDTYEREYRSDVIINRLDRIIYTIDELKAMNILLYQAVQQTNIAIAEVHRGINEQNERLGALEQSFGLGIGLLEQNVEASKLLSEITDTNLKNIEELVQYQNFVIKQQRLKEGYWY